MAVNDMGVGHMYPSAFRVNGEMTEQMVSFHYESFFNHGHGVTHPSPASRSLLPEYDSLIRIRTSVHTLMYTNVYTFILQWT